MSPVIFSYIKFAALNLLAFVFCLTLVIATAIRGEVNGFAIAGLTFAALGLGAATAQFLLNQKASQEYLRRPRGPSSPV